MRRENMEIAEMLMRQYEGRKALGLDPVTGLKPVPLDYIDDEEKDENIP
jgi:hypothetical protein